MNDQGLKDVATRLRINSILSTNQAKSGHPTTCSSIAEIMSVLFFDVMRYSIEEPKNPANDRFVLSKGHAAPILYAAWAEAGLFPASELIDNLRKLHSDLEGHPTPRLNFIDVATGSLGQGLSVSAGMAYAGKYVDKSPYRVYCLVGDGELAEGSNWEAMAFASHYKLNNLCAIFDINRLGQSEPTPLQHQAEVYKARISAFGWNAQVVNGHNVTELREAFKSLENVQDCPQAIIAITYKGRDFLEIEDAENWHGKPLGDKAEPILKSLQSKLSSTSLPVKLNGPQFKLPQNNFDDIRLDSPPNYRIGDKVATRLAYGTALVKLGNCNPKVIACDGDTKNSTFSETYKKAFPSRFVECFIAEQNLVGVGIGLGCRGRSIPFVSTFAAFLTRAFDQIRMAAISQANLKLVGSHCGVSIGEDGPSQMGLEDIAMFRTIPGCNVFYPSDAVSLERAVELAAQHKGLDFIRTSRPATPVVYANEERFEIGKSKVVLSHGNEDRCLVIGAGVTLHEALSASETLKKQHNVKVRVLDPFTIKPLDVQGIKMNALECYGKVLVVEDHYPEGGIGECVSSALSTVLNMKVKSLAVSEIPRSGPPSDLIEKYGIGAKSIVAAVLSLIN